MAGERVCGDPQSASSINTIMRGCDCGWAPHRPLDAKWSLRWTELDLVSWLVANDVVVCDAASDAGADTYAYQLLPPAKFAAKTPCVVSPR